MKLPLFSKLAFATMCLSSSVFAQMTINYNFDASVTDADKTLFNQAKAFWEGNLTGYVDGNARTVTIAVSLFSEGPDASGSITLGQAAPQGITYFDSNSVRYVTTSSGMMQFNTSAEAAAVGGYDASVVRHELGHVLGFGTLWGYQTQFNGQPGGATGQNLYVDGTGQFTGANALAAYRAEFGAASAATYVPVELDFGAGTADGHWNETPNNPLDAHVDDQHAAYRNAANQSMNDEMMTGNKSGSLWLSKTTLGSFRDLGFTIVPEPSVVTLAGVGALALLRRRRN